MATNGDDFEKALAYKICTNPDPMNTPFPIITQPEKNDTIVDQII
jgi:hypothetical protein